jgi:DNA-binding MarR family transcriptional regulator
MAGSNAHLGIQLQPQRFPLHLEHIVQRRPPAVVGTLEEFEEVAQLIAHARRKVWSSVGRVLALEGEVVLGWALVSVLSRFGPRSQRDLADFIAQHPAGISRQLAELDAAGLTTRTRDATDGRCRLVALTSKGQRWQRRWRPRVLAAVRDVLGVLDEGERRVLRGTLQKVLSPPLSPPLSRAQRAGRRRQVPRRRLRSSASRRNPVPSA